MEGGAPDGSSMKLPSNAELQEHLTDTSPKLSTASASGLEPAGSSQQEDPTTTTTTEFLPAPHATHLTSSYKSPVELLSAPSSGRVVIAGRRLATGEMVPAEVIHLHDYPPTTPTAAAGNPDHGDGAALHTPITATCSGTTPTTTNAPTPASSAAAAAATPPSSSTIQETAKTAEQVYVTHATVAAAAAAAGGLVVGGAHLDVRTAANVAEAAVDPAAVVDFDCMSPTAAAAAAASPTAALVAADEDVDGSESASHTTTSTAGMQQGDQPAAHAAAAAAGGLVDVTDSIAGHAVLPEDRDEVAATLQRLRIEGQVQGPGGGGASAGDPQHTASTAAAAGAGSTTDDTFIRAAASAGAGAGAAGSMSGTSSIAPGSSSSADATMAAQATVDHPSAEGVSAGTAAPAKAGYPNPSTDASSEQQASSDPADDSHTARLHKPSAGSSSSSGLLAMHEAASRAAAVAGALVHIGQPVTTAAVLAGTATQPAAAVEATAAASTADVYEESSPATSTAARAGSLHQQHTLADFLLDADNAAAVVLSGLSPAADSSAAASSAHQQVDLSLGSAAAAGAAEDDDLQVQLDVGRSTRLLAADGRVAAAAATVPEEAVAALKATDPSSTTTSSSSATTPQHPSLRQLSLSCQPDQHHHQQSSTKQAAGELPYGLTVADIVAATVASEERRFRVVSPRGSPGSSATPRSAGHDTFFTASSGSVSQSDAAAAAAAAAADAPVAVERSSSPLSASATRAIFDSVQLAVQQQQQQQQEDQTVQAVVGGDAGSGPVVTHGTAQHAAAQPTAGPADASVAGRAVSTGSGDSTATSGVSAGSAGTSPEATTGHAGAGAEKPPAAQPSQSHSVTSASSSRSGGDSGAVTVTVENAAIMQEMLLQDVSSAAELHRAAAVSGTPMSGGELSVASTASECGDSDTYKAAVGGSTDAGSDAAPSSSNTRTGERMAAAVAAGRADGVGAAASGADVAAIAAPAFPAVLFGPAPLPVDVPAEQRSPVNSSSGDEGSMGQQDTEAAAALARRGMTGLGDDGDVVAEQASGPEAAAEAALQQVIDATSTAAISSGGLDAAAAAAGAAAAAATDMHAGFPDPAGAAADAALLVVDAATTVPGLLELSEVPSVAAAAGAAAAAAATPGMDATTAAIASAAAAASPLCDPATAGAAAALAVMELETAQETAVAPAVATASAGEVTGFGGGLISDVQCQQQAPGASLDAASTAVHVQTAAPVPGSDLAGLLPILAPAGQVGDTVTVLVPASATETSSSAASTVSDATAPAQLQSVPESSEVEVASSDSSGGSAAEVFQDAASGGAQGTAGTAEMLSAQGLSQSKMFDPLVVQLAMATSAPLEGLGLDESTLLRATAASDVSSAERAVSSSSDSMHQSASGMLLLQPHPLAGAESLGPGPVEGGAMFSHLDAAAAALSQLDSKLQRQRTDSISLGAGHSSAPGELDMALAAISEVVAAAAPAGPDDDVPAAGSGALV